MKTCLRSLLIFSLFLSFSVLAQYSEQPVKESSDDLRDGQEMFLIHDIEEGREIWLERTAGEDYFLRMKEKKDEKLIKIAANEAKKLDREFASKFLKCLYELAPSTEGCKVSLKLKMKGETQDICGKDENKAQELYPFAKKLQKKF